MSLDEFFNLQMIPIDEKGGMMVQTQTNPTEKAISQLYNLFMVSEDKKTLIKFIKNIKNNFSLSDKQYIFQEVLEALVLQEATQENDDNVLFLLEHAGPFMEDINDDDTKKLKEKKLYVPKTTKMYFIHLFFKHMSDPNLLYQLFRTQKIDPNITNKDITKTPLESAIEKRKRQPIINCLLEMGAKATQKIIELDNSQGTNYISNYQTRQGVEFSLEYTSLYY